jgi:hypothetical protein
MNNLSQDTLFEIASFLTVTEYCNSFISVCSAFYDTTTYETVWSHFYEQRLVADINRFKEEKNNRLNSVSGLHKKHILQNTAAKNRLLRGDGYLTALSNYCFASRLSECQSYITRTFKKPANKTKRDIETYNQFIEPYERVFSEMNKLFAYVGPSQDEENVKRRRSIIKILHGSESYNGKSFLQWFFFDLVTALANPNISQSDIVKYTQETLYKLVHTYEIHIMCENEFKRTGNDHFALVVAIRTGILPLIDTIIQLYQHEQTYKLYGGMSLLETVIQYCPNNYQYYLESPILFPEGYIKTVMKGTSTVYTAISRYATTACMQYLFDHFGFDPSRFDPSQCNGIAGCNRYDTIAWCFDHGMLCHNEKYQPFLHCVITNAYSENIQADRTLEILKLVLSRPECDVLVVDNQGFDAIMNAIYHSHSRENIQMLIEHGADPYRTIDFATPLSMALRFCSFDKIMEIQDLFANETTIRYFNNYHENAVRQVLERISTVEHAVAILKLWMEKFNIDVNEQDPSRQGTKEYFQNNYPHNLERVQQVFDALGVELK